MTRQAQVARARLSTYSLLPASELMMSLMTKHCSLALINDQGLVCRRRAWLKKASGSPRRIIGLLLRSGEQRAIRSGRSVNIDRITQKELSLFRDEEHAMVIQTIGGARVRPSTVPVRLLTKTLLRQSVFCFSVRLAAPWRSPAHCRAARCPQPRHWRQRCQHHPVGRRRARAAPVAREARREPSPRTSAAGCR